MTNCTECDIKNKAKRLDKIETERLAQEKAKRSAEEAERAEWEAAELNIQTSEL